MKRAGKLLTVLATVGISISFPLTMLGPTGNTWIGKSTAKTTATPQSPVKQVPKENSEALKRQAVETYGKLPRSFEANHGQTDPAVKFISRGSGYSLFLTLTEAVLTLRNGDRRIERDALRSPDSPPCTSHPSSSPDTVLRMKIVGANPDPEPQITGLEELPGKVNYFIGNDPKKWRTNVSTYAKVKYENVYPGVNLVYHGNQRQLEYDFVLRPGADPNQIRLGFAGAQEIGIDETGDLVLTTKGGDVRQHKPVVYQEVAGSRKEIAGSYVVKANREIGFEIGSYDMSQPLVIDPVLSYSTYIGGNNDDWGNGIAVDSAGNAYVTGYTLSTNFPTLNAYQTNSGGLSNAFVTKLTPGGGLSYSTYLGGNGNIGNGYGDVGNGIAVDSAGNAYVTGYTWSTNFPTLNAYQTSNRGYADAFVTKLTACGGISYSTYLGGDSVDGGNGIAIDSTGNTFVTGLTLSTNFPTLNAYQANSRGSWDAFVTNLNLSGAPPVVISEFRTRGPGGANDEFVELYNNTDCAVDVSGWKIRGSNNAASINTLVTIINGTRIPAGGHFLATNNGTSGYSGSVPGDQTYSSGITDNGGIAFTRPDDSVVDQAGMSAGSAFREGSVLAPLATNNNESYERKPGGLSGSTQDTNSNAGDFQVITPSDPQNLNSNPTPGLTPTATPTLVYSTYLGGDGTDYGQGIAVDSAGNAYVTGYTASGNFPTLNAYQASKGDNTDGFSDSFVTKLTASGGLSYSTYLGGNRNDWGYGIAVDSAGNAYLTGYTDSTNFPTLNAYQANNLGVWDVFVTKLTATGGLSYSTYLGGSGGNGIAVDAAGNAYVTGATSSADFQTVNPLQPFLNSSQDGFVAKIFDSSIFSVGAIVSNRGGNSGDVSVSVLGAGFQPGATVKLKVANQPDIAGTNTIVINSSKIITTFDLRGASPGPRDVVVTLPDSLTATLRDGFTIEQGGSAQVWVDIIGRDTIRLGRQQTYNIVYGNRGNIDVEDEHFIVLSCPANGNLVVDRAIAAYGDPPYPPVVDGSEQAVAILVPPLGAQSSGSFTARFTTPSNASVVIRVAIISIRSFETTPGFANQTTAQTILTNLITEASDETPPVGATVYLGPHGGNPFGHQAIVGVDPMTNQVVIWDHFLLRKPYTLEEWRQAWPGAPYLGWAKPPGWTPTNGDEAGRVARSLVLEGAIPDATAGKNFFQNNRYSCAGLCELAYERAGLNPNSFGLDLLLLPGVNYRRDTGKIDFYPFVTDLNADLRIPAVWLKQLSDQVGGWLYLFSRAQSSTERVLQVVAAMDPNEKTGSLGTGGQRYISGGEPLRYAIFFENVATATAPAQEVVITDQLDTAKLDLNTFGFGPIAFGNKLVTPPPGLSEFNQDVDLRPTKNLIVRINARLDKSTGLLTWRFTSIDPVTGLPPEDPLAGFLPPNITPPEGEGSVLFTVMPKQGLATGTEIRNQARIIFDANAPIDTPQWFNTLDNTKPTSNVLALPAAQNSASFQVQWQGTDVGAGVLDFTIFVSENGGPFTPWLRNTPATSGTFTGQPGKTYAFYSVAHDRTGNTEDAPTTADATTQVASADQAITKTASPNPVQTGSNITYTIGVTNTGPNAATAVTVSDNLPASTTFISCSATTGGVCGGSGNNRTVTFGSLASGASATITLIATVNSSLANNTVISNTATVSSSTPDPDLTNNSATATTTASNTPPTITGTTISRQQGSPVSSSQIATVSDANQAANTLVVTVNGSSSATVNGVTVSGLSVNAAGTVMASVVASCAASNASFTLTVTDNQSGTASSQLNVNVTTNSAPALGTYPATVPINVGTSTTVTPSAAPSDNGSITGITATAPGFTGTLTVNAVGIVSVANAGPAGTFTITVKATDNCGAQSSRSFTLTIANNNCNVTVDPATIAQPYVAVPYLQLLSASPAASYTFSVSAGALPPGLNLITALGVTSIAGIPTTPGTYSFTIKAKKNNSSCEATRSYTVAIPVTVVPILECVQRNANGSYTAHFGYNNQTGAAVTIPVGANNYFTPGNQNRGQTTVFQPGRVTNAFSVTFRANGSNLAVWFLKGSDGVLRPVNVTTTSIGCP